MPSFNEQGGMPNAGCYPLAGDGFTDPALAIRDSHGQPRTHMPVRHPWGGSRVLQALSLTNQDGKMPGVRCPRCAERGIEQWVLPGKHCPRCNQPCRA